MSKREKDTYLVQPVLKALRVLEVVAEQGHDVSLATVCSLTGIPKTSAFRYLQTLVAAGFLGHDTRRDRYASGMKLSGIAKADTSLRRLREVAYPHLQELVAEFRETVNLAVPMENTIVYVDVLEVERPLRIQAQVGMRHPMHSTALGKAILAFLPPEEQAAYFSHPLTEMTGRTLLEKQAIRRQLQRAAALGYASESGENEDGAMCIGAPILDTDQRPIAAISISAPLQRSTRDLVKSAGTALIGVARTISTRVGL